MANLTPYFDGNAWTFPATAAGAISGGTFYRTGSYTNTVASAETYDYTEVLVTLIGSGQFCAGVAMYDRASGTSNEVAMMRRGIVLALSNGNVNAGARAASATATADSAPVVGPPTAGRNGDDIVGTILTEAASGNFCYLMLNL